MNKLTLSELERQLRMQASRSRSKRESMLVAAKHLHFAPAEIDEMREEFLARLPPESKMEAGIDHNEFAHMIQHIKLPKQLGVDFLFSAFDVDGNGILTFQEIMVGLSALVRGSPDDKLRLAFNAFDTTKTGTLKEVELRGMLETIYHQQNGTSLPMDALASLFSSMDTDQNGEIDMDEFVEGAVRSSFLVDCLLTPLEIDSWNEGHTNDNDEQDGTDTSFGRRPTIKFAQREKQKVKDTQQCCNVS